MQTWNQPRIKGKDLEIGAEILYMKLIPEGALDRVSARQTKKLGQEQGANKITKEGHQDATNRKR